MDEILYSDNSVSESVSPTPGHLAEGTARERARRGSRSTEADALRYIKYLNGLNHDRGDTIQPGDVILVPVIR